MPTLRVLYVASEISPFLCTSGVATYVRALVPAMQEKNVDIRILVPRFGVIHERRNRLHEVVRLSGMGINVGGQMQDLFVKVTTIPNTRIQVYFIDNPIYFQRKFVFEDTEGSFFSDNDERLIFLCKGALATVKNLNWAPNIIHCHDWMTSLIPVYLKTIFKGDPFFHRTKVLFNMYNTGFKAVFEGNFSEKAMLDRSSLGMGNPASVGFRDLLHVAAKHADRVVKSEFFDMATISSYLSEKNIPLISTDQQGIDLYYKIYRKLVDG